jgi:hypothetical protein
VAAANDAKMCERGGKERGGKREGEKREGEEREGRSCRIREKERASGRK